MKRLLITSFLVSVLYSCDKNERASTEPAEPIWRADSTSVVINDNIWPSNAVKINSINDSIFTLSIDIKKTLSNGVVYSYENLYFKMLRKTIGLQALDSTGFSASNIITKPTVYFFTTDNYDTGNEVFEVYRKDSADNWIQIREQRNNYKEIKGVFNVTLIKTNDGQVYKYPDTIKIRDGYFRVTMD